MPTDEEVPISGDCGNPEESGKALSGALTSGSGSLPSNSELELVRQIVHSVSERYEILEEVGHGSWGIVYRARDRETDEIIALKALRPDLANDIRTVDRFKRELRLARRITHKNVCRVYEFQRTSTICFVTMEFVDGETLRSFLHRQGAVNLEEGLSIARQVCAAVREAHKQGIVHRDLKPENVMVDRSGLVKVMDFGIARSFNTISTSTCGILGTPAYMAPEQAKGEDVDPRTDIYAIGLIMFEMFTGVAAFAAAAPLALIWKQVHEAPVHPRDLEPSVPAALEKLILRCLEKHPDRRYQTAEELDHTLGRVLHQSGRDERESSVRCDWFPWSWFQDPWFLTALSHQLPRPPRWVSLSLLMLLQLLFLTFYLVALGRFRAIHSVLDYHLPNLAGILAETIRVTAIVGIALRLYLSSGICFDYKGLGNDFRRLSFLLVPLDVLWALSPLLLLGAGKLGSLAFASIIPLAFLPFTQRTLVRMAYPRVAE